MKVVIAWTLHRLAGVLLVLMLVVHFLVMHFLGQEARISYDIVIRRLSGTWWKAFDLAFISLVLYHGFYGMWGIAIEYVHKKSLLNVCKGAIVASVVGLLITAIYIVAL